MCFVCAAVCDSALSNDGFYDQMLKCPQTKLLLAAATSSIQSTNALLLDGGYLDGRSQPRQAKKMKLYHESNWGKMLKEEKEKLLDPDSKESKIFRNRFRVPYPIFLRLVQWTKSWYDKDDSVPGSRKSDCSIGAYDAVNNPSIPCELKVLGVLRILGRGICLDDVEELTNISKTTMHKFFHLWTKKFREHVTPEHVKIPETAMEIEEVLKPYEAVGFPGAMGCTDVVHIWWDKCPISLTNLYTGKEGYPTIAYEMTCDHSGRILYCTPGFYGSQNDKSIIRFDGLVTKLRSGSHAHVSYELFDESGEKYVVKDPYLLVDGGYHKWRHTITASRLNVDPDFILWRKRLESVRKDIENVFGKLKGRFRILKLPLSYHNKDDIDNIVHCVAGLHNMLHDWDDLSLWEKDVDWAGEDSYFDDEDESLTINGRRITRTTDYSIFGANYLRQRLVETRAEESATFFDLVNKLVTHFKVASSKNIVTWLRS
jgi:hypothetical protein